MKTIESQIAHIIQPELADKDLDKQNATADVLAFEIAQATKRYYAERYFKYGFIFAAGVTIFCLVLAKIF